MTETSFRPEPSQLLALCRELEANCESATREPDDILMVVFSDDVPRYLIRRTALGMAVATEIVQTDQGNLVLRPFPPEQDRELPGAHLLANRTLLAERLGIDATELQVLRHRPGSRVVVRVGSGPRVRYVKLLSRKGYRRAVETFAALRELAPSHGLALPDETWESEAALVSSPVPGVALSDRLRGDPRVDLPALVGWVSRLASTNAPSKLGARTLEDERHSTLTMLRRGSWILPELTEVAARVAKLEVPRWEGAGLVHTDFHDKQIFVSGDRIRVLDCEGMRRGPCAIDVANFVEHLHLRARQHPQQASALETLAAEFLAGSGSRPPPQEFAIARTLVRARLAGVYALRPAWHALARTLASTWDLPA